MVVRLRDPSSIDQEDLVQVPDSPSVLGVVVGEEIAGRRRSESDLFLQFADDGVPPGLALERTSSGEQEPSPLARYQQEREKLLPKISRP